MRKLLLFYLFVELSAYTYGQKVTQIVPLENFSARAIDQHNGKLLFGANQARFGFYDIKANKYQLFTIKGISEKTEFRAVTASETGYFILSAGSPALLYKVELDGSYQEVYRDEHPKTFYNSMKQIDSQLFIAIGDQIEGCLAVLISANAGKSWHRTACSDLPKFQEKEGAFAASNTNIVVKDSLIWIALGVNSSRIIKSMDKGQTWSVAQTGIANKGDTQGIYSMDFYDQKNGIVWGGDYTNPKGEDLMVASITSDGGETWQKLETAKKIGYRSSVQFVPNSNAKKIVVSGFQGVAYSKDKGKTWQVISKASYYSIRFINEQIAYLVGKDGIGLLELDE